MYHIKKEELLIVHQREDEDVICTYDIFFTRNAVKENYDTLGVSKSFVVSKSLSYHALYTQNGWYI